MAKSNLVKRGISEAGKRLITARGIDSVSVMDIVRECEVDKSTFYYHFRGKLDLVIWTFRHDMGRALLKRYPPESLVFGPAGSDDRFSSMPFYVDARNEADALNLGGFWTAIDEALSDKSYYRRVLTTHDVPNFEDYLIDLYYHEFRKDVRFAAGGRIEDPLIIDFFSSFFTNSSVGLLVYSITGMHPLPMAHSEEDVLIFENNAHDSMRFMVERYVSMSGQGKPGTSSLWVPTK
ncbi:MAG: TetR/AcrR family transcriptional regulator [Coriobacteriales bacterium]